MWVKATFERLAAGQRLDGADAWLAFAQERGPTPLHGPLRHEWMLPSVMEPTQVGLNVFSDDAASSARVREILVAAGAGGPWLLDEDALRYHGGMAWRGGRGVMKIYVSGPTPALALVADELHVRFDDDVFAIALDVTPEGPGRPRAYRRAHTVHPEGRWDRYPAWAAIEPQGLSHRVVGALDPPHAAIAKRSYIHIFAPGAEIDSLVKTAAAVEQIDADLPVSFDAELLRALQPPDLVVRPAAYEADLYADGRRATDAFITIACGARA